MCHVLTLIHVLNFSIPIAFIVIAGFLLDRMCKPFQQEKKLVMNSPRFIKPAFTYLFYAAPLTHSF